MSKTVAVAEFQEHSIELLEEMVEKQDEVVVLKDGKPWAKVIPIPSAPIQRDLESIRALGGRVLGDIVEPLEEWDMMK